MEYGKCPECGANVDLNARFCASCGNSLVQVENTDTSNVQMVEQTASEDTPVSDSNDCCSQPEPETIVSPADSGLPAKPKKRIGLIVAGVAVAAIVVACVAVFGMLSAQRNSYNEYVDNLTSARATMLDGAAQAETVCNTVYKIWHAAIFEDDEDWDSDIAAYKSDDFNDALAMYYADSSTKQKVSEIKTNQSEVDELMSKLNNPPDDMKTACSTLNDMYEVYSNLTGLAVSPTGSLQTFSSNFHQYDNDFLTKFKKLENQIPEKK